MDRFIADSFLKTHSNMFYLKSNMDRFIDPMSNNIAKRVIDLKSNMDRFIVLFHRKCVQCSEI